MVIKKRFMVGFWCKDGSFSCLTKNRKWIRFNTEKDAKKEIKKLQQKYKHKLTVEKIEYLDYNE